MTTLEWIQIPKILKKGRKRGKVRFREWYQVTKKRALRDDLIYKMLI